jgi:2-(1,2-epoxy-1,2-dihydrophenyl)acetyl-CoA isomerase
MSAEILIERAAGITSVTMNRPLVKNALTQAMCRELICLFESLPTDAATRVLVIRGGGTDFSAGADLKELSMSLDTTPAARSAAVSQQVRELSWPLFLALHRVPQPVIASARGYAVGAGAQLLFSADLVIASTTTRISVPQVKLGHSVDHGESWYLPRKIGVSRALQLALLGDAVGAQDAERFGIISWLVSDTELEARTVELAARLANSSTIALTETKRLMRAGLDRSISEQFEAEAQAIGACAASPDFAEAIAAAVAKRKPVFGRHH